MDIGERFEKQFGTRSDYFNHRIGLFTDMKKWIETETANLKEENERLKEALKDDTKEEQRKLLKQVIDTDQEYGMYDVPQPEPEESQDELAGEIVNAIWNLREDSSHLNCVNYIRKNYFIQRKKQ